MTVKSIFLKTRLDDTSPNSKFITSYGINYNCLTMGYDLKPTLNFSVLPLNFSVVSLTVITDATPSIFAELLILHPWLFYFSILGSTNPLPGVP